MSRVRLTSSPAGRLGHRPGARRLRPSSGGNRISESPDEASHQAILAVLTGRRPPGNPSSTVDSSSWIMSRLL